MATIMGQRIKELRILADISQEELGRRVGVQRAAINKYEKGTVENIPIVTIEKIAKVFDVSPQYIVGWNGDESNPLATEVKIIQGVNKLFGADSVELLEVYLSLNPTGKKRALQYLCEIERIYQQD